MLAAGTWKRLVPEGQEGCPVLCFIAALHHPGALWGFGGVFYFILLSGQHWFLLQVLRTLLLQLLLNCVLGVESLHTHIALGSCAEF